MKSFKQTCIELREKDYTLGEIMEITGRGKTTVYFHIRNIKLSKEKEIEISNNSRKRALANSLARKGVALRPFKPFKKWKPELVLLTEHLMFGGRLYKSCEYNNRSEALISRVESLMKVVYDFEPISSLNKVTGVHRISYHNVAMANFFKERAKELKKEIVKLPKDCRREFVRAFFDDEGCMDCNKEMTKKRIRGYQDDKDILYIMQNLLASFNIESKLQGRNEVVIFGKENLAKFRDEINFSEGIYINPNRTNSRWKRKVEKRELLDMAIKSFKK